MQNDGELEKIMRREQCYHSFKKYLPFIFTEDNLLKINFKNKVLLIVPKSLRYEIISLSHCEWYTEAVPGGVL